MKISKKHKEELKDQAGQILYFEASMYDEEDAYNLLLERLTEIYKIAYEAGAKSK
jgi:hypothetical protein